MKLTVALAVAGLLWAPSALACDLENILDPAWVEHQVSSGMMTQADAMAEQNAARLQRDRNLASAMQTFEARYRLIQQGKTAAAGKPASSDRRAQISLPFGR